MKRIVLIVVFLLASMPVFADTKYSYADKQSPYLQYDREYRYLYQTGQMSRLDYLDRMRELKTAEMNRRRGIANDVLAYAVVSQRQNKPNMSFLNNPSKRPTTYSLHSQTTPMMVNGPGDSSSYSTTGTIMES